MWDCVSFMKLILLESINKCHFVGESRIEIGTQLTWTFEFVDVLINFHMLRENVRLYTKVASCGRKN